VALKSLVSIKDDQVNRKDTLKWKWANGTQTAAGDFGDPVAADDYRLCVYEGATLRSDVPFPSGGVCDGKPCWKALGNPAGAKGFQYKSKARGKLALKPGIAGKAQIKLTAKGASAILPPLPLASLPLRVQLNGAGNCWETTFDAATTNDSQKFQAKGPS
jgi:hypothetical protein